jgi:hypothetical protein
VDIEAAKSGTDRKEVVWIYQLESAAVGDMSHSGASRMRRCLVRNECLCLYAGPKQLIVNTCAQDLSRAQ